MGLNNHLIAGGYGPKASLSVLESMMLMHRPFALASIA